VFPLIFNDRFADGNKIRPMLLCFTQSLDITGRDINLSSLESGQRSGDTIELPHVGVREGAPGIAVENRALQRADSMALA
jgi:hypothetical protein